MVYLCLFFLFIALHEESNNNTTEDVGLPNQDVKVEDTSSVISSLDDEDKWYENLAEKKQTF